MAERIAVVTGAGSGIGRAVAVALARLDYLVVLSGRRSERLATTAEHVARAGGDSLVVAADVTDPASVERLFAATMTSTGRLDLLVNNAGVSAPAIPLEELPVGEWRAVIDTQPDRCVPLHPAGGPDHEGPAAEGRTDHQQRLRVRVRASPARGRLHGQ